MIKFIFLIFPIIFCRFSHFFHSYIKEFCTFGSQKVENLQLLKLLINKLIINIVNKINPQENYESSQKAIGYVSRKEAQQSDYDRIGFTSGLEVHQQLKTDHKLFCRCSAGVFQKPEQYDAELFRHMRPTLSEMGEYDGTALMEFKTKKNIIYRIANKTACTYDVDDTPPFPINPQALQYALEVALASN